MNGIPDMKDLTDRVDGIMEIAREAAHHFFTWEARPVSAKHRTEVKTALEDLRRALDSHSKRLLDEATTDFEKLRVLIKAKLAEKRR